MLEEGARRAPPASAREGAFAADEEARILDVLRTKRSDEWAQALAQEGIDRADVIRWRGEEANGALQDDTGADVAEWQDAKPITNAEKTVALEAVSDKAELSDATRSVLLAVGVGPHAHRVERPWGEADDVMLRRLVGVRRWSAKAIGVFLNREEREVSQRVARLRRRPRQILDRRDDG